MRGYESRAQRDEKECIRARPVTPKCALSVACSARKAGMSQPLARIRARVRVGEAGVEWDVCLYWVVRGWNPMWGWWEVCQRQRGVGWGVGEGGVVVGVWSSGVGREGVPCSPDHGEPPSTTTE
jgi:hypothetical protein